jgi:hypothetical protein
MHVFALALRLVRNAVANPVAGKRATISFAMLTAISTLLQPSAATAEPPRKTVSQAMADQDTLAMAKFFGAGMAISEDCPGHQMTEELNGALRLFMRADPTLAVSINSFMSDAQSAYGLSKGKAKFCPRILKDYGPSSRTPAVVSSHGQASPTPTNDELENSDEAVIEIARGRDGMSGAHKMSARRIGKADLEGSWPFKADSVVVGCVPRFNAQTYVAIIGGKAFALSGLTLPHASRLAVKIGDRQAPVRERMGEETLLPGFSDHGASKALIEVNERTPGCATR